MSDFKTKLHQNRLRLGSAPHPAGAGGAYRAPPDRQTPELDLKGPTSKGRGYRKGGEGEREGKVWGGKEEEGRVTEGRKGGDPLAYL